MTKQSRLISKPTGPTKTDLQRVRNAYKKWQKDALLRNARWDAINCNTDVASCEAMDAEEWKVVQVAFIKATSYVNSHNRWPLVLESYVVNMLAAHRML